MDTDTLKEVFKYLNYCDLANNSLASKRFSDLIRTHRHRFACLDVSSMALDFIAAKPSPVKIFNEKLSSEAYNEWVVRNEYSKQIPVESQVSMKQSIQYGVPTYLGTVYYFKAVYKDPNYGGSHTTVFTAFAELNHENWPLFQHFIRLLTDPFIFIQSLLMTPPSEVLNLLAGAINPNRKRLQCKKLECINLTGNLQEFMNWIKNHVCCDTIRIDDSSFLNSDPEYFDFFVTAQCTTAIVRFYDLSDVVVDLVQKFMDLKTCDESQTVETIRGSMKDRGVVAVLKRNYATCEEYTERRITNQVIKFINDNIGKSLELIVTVSPPSDTSHFALKIENL
ncbi:hypothetical protein DdX_15425 [Ditylenchus destructor]|uniref:F-box domain-containing protein n=1 Tax=Ditylenchus destructor TaxID=166010 RepID=A0AAD4R0Z6_9BILA|nr:hypothetical protein DdX_15425 [Ditylenchus destructor]